MWPESIIQTLECNHKNAYFICIMYVDNSIYLMYKI